MAYGLEEMLRKILAPALFITGLVSPSYAQDALAKPEDKIIFVSEDEGKFKLYSMKIDRTEREPLKCGGNFNFYNSNLSVSPDGKSLAFETQGPDKYFHIYTLDIASGNVTQVTATNQHDFQPAWSPKGDKIAFSRQYNTLEWEICTINPDRTGFMKLTDAPETQNSWSAWSPDGSKIAFVSSIYTQNEKTATVKSKICVIGSDGKNLEEILTPLPIIEELAWSPKGNELAYIAESNGHFDIYVVDVTGEKKPRNLTNYSLTNEPHLSARSISWSADGDFILFGSSRGAGHVEKKITNRGEKSERAWSDYDSEICRIPAKGGEIENLTNNPDKIEQEPAYLYDN